MPHLQMEFRLTPLRVLILLLLLAGYWWVGGFEMSTRIMDANRNLRAMFYRALLFIGASCVSVIEHETGILHRTSLRPFYVVLGLLLMAAAVVWTRALDVK